MMRAAPQLRLRLQAVLLLLFCLMLSLVMVGVDGMRTTLHTLTAFREEVMPALARVLVLAEKVSRMAAIAPDLADPRADAAREDDIARLQALMQEVRQLAGTLPPGVAAELSVSPMLAGSAHNLQQLLLLSGERRRRQQHFAHDLQRLDRLGQQLAHGAPQAARRAPALLLLWQTLLAVPLARDHARLGVLEAEAEALLLAMRRRHQWQALPGGPALERMLAAPDNLFMQQRQLLEISDSMALLVQLYRGNAEHLSRHATAHVQTLRARADERSARVQAAIHVGMRCLLLLAVLGVLVALLAAAYVRRVARDIQSIAGVMSKLAAGDTGQATPAIRRRDEIGELARAFQVFRDMLLEKQRLSQEMTAQQRLLQTVFLSMNDGLSVHDENGALVVWNPRFPAMLGLAADALFVGMPYSVLRAATPPGARWQVLGQDVATHVGTTRERIASKAELYLPDGRVLEFFSRAMPQGGWVAVCRDVSARRAAESQVRQMQKMEVLGQLTGGVAHDFNNILQAVLGNLELLEARDDLPPAVRSRLARTHSAANKAAALTRRLLAFARRQPLCSEFVDIGDMLHEMLDLIEYSVGEGIAVSIDAADGLRVCVDRGQLENAVLNLALNAAQAMGKCGVLQLQAMRCHDGHPLADGDAICLSVRDNGPGIPADVLPRVLEPFFSTKAYGQGSGLGLSIVYGFVRQSGGELDISSEQGQGTLVRLCLPAAAPGCTLAAHPGTMAFAVRPCRVLLVEDDADVCDTAQALLAQLGAHTHAESGAAAALDWLQAGGVADLVLSDVMLGSGNDGVQLYRSVQQRWPQLPVILTSGLPPEHHARHGDWPCQARFLAKPYTLQDLACLLQQLPLP